MKLRFILARIGMDASDVQIDEALQLASLYFEELQNHFCPFMGKE